MTILAALLGVALRERKQYHSAPSAELNKYEVNRCNTDDNVTVIENNHSRFKHWPVSLTKLALGENSPVANDWKRSDPA